MLEVSVILAMAHKWAQVGQRELEHARLLYFAPMRPCAAPVELVIQSDGFVAQMTVSDVFDAEFPPTDEGQGEVRGILNALISGGCYTHVRGRVQMIVFGAEADRQIDIKRSWCAWHDLDPPSSVTQLSYRLG